MVAEAAKEAAGAAKNAVTGTASGILRTALSAKFWAFAGIGLFVCAAAAPVAVGATISSLPAATGFGTGLANVGTVAGSALVNGAPVVVSGAWNSAVSMIPAGAGGVSEKIAEETLKQTTNLISGAPTI